jgi:hypothetical protein
MWPAEDVAEEGAGGVGIVGVDERMHCGDHLPNATGG